MGIIDWWRRHQENKRRQKQAREAYREALSRVDLHAGLDQLRRTLDDVLNNPPEHLRNSHREDTQWSRARSLVQAASNDVELLTVSSLAKLNLALRRLVGSGINSFDWAYEQINLARIDHEMGPAAPRRNPDLLLDPDEEALLVEDVTITRETDATDPESGQDVVVSEQRSLRIEVTTRRLALMTDHASVFDLKHVRVARLLTDEEVSLTIDNVSYPIIFRSDIAPLIRETIEFARQQRLRQA